MPVQEHILSGIVIAFVFAFGACIGSFLNVVIYRVPRQKSVVLPASSCTSCGTRIPFYALIPIFGYFLVRGRCKNCAAPISLRYPLVELLTAGVTLFLFLHYMSPIEFIAILGGENSLPTFGRFQYQTLIPLFTSLWLAYTGIALTFIDIEFRILPDVITLPGILVGLALASLNAEVGFKSSLLGILTGAGLLWLVAKSYEYLRSRDGLGFGDVKYLAFIGAVLGWKSVIWTIAVSSILGTFYGLSVGVVKKQGLSTAIPFGPFIAIAALLVHVWGKAIQSFLYG